VVNALSANRDILAQGWRTQKSSKNQVTEQYQEMDDLDNMTQKPTSETPREGQTPLPQSGTSSHYYQGLNS
jgi:hypothetical protein